MLLFLKQVKVHLPLVSLLLRPRPSPSPRLLLLLQMLLSTYPPAAAAHVLLMFLVLVLVLMHQRMLIWLISRIQDHRPQPTLNEDNLSLGLMMCPISSVHSETRAKMRIWGLTICVRCYTKKNQMNSIGSFNSMHTPKVDGQRCITKSTLACISNGKVSLC